MKSGLFRFTDIFKETLWGGRRILPFKGLAADDRPIGESWELSGIPGSESVVAGGAYDGMTLTRLAEAGGRALSGAHNFERFGTRFPLLVKFIDAALPLSVQVHPGDELSMRRHGCPGKSEVWYVMDAAPGSCLLNGFKRQVTEEEYAERVAADTLPEVLRHCAARRGDVHYLPAGRVHSIGAGCFICEIQQSSDVTYRIYDFGRVGSDGRPRRLHVEEAREAIDYAVAETEPSREIRADVRTELVRSPFFTVGAYRLTRPATLDYAGLDSFVVLVCTEGACRVSRGGEEARFAAGHTLLVSAETENVTVEPERETVLLESYV